MVKLPVIKMSVDEEIKVNLSKVLAKGKQQNEKTQNIKIKYVEIDEFLDLIGPFNKAQMLLVAMFCLIIIPSVYQTLIMSFAGNSPPWKCSGKSYECNSSSVYTINDESSFKLRCNMSRASWEFVKNSEFSIVTEVCFFL